jgi:hypothetical protein
MTHGVGAGGAILGAGYVSNRVNVDATSQSIAAPTARRDSTPAWLWLLLAAVASAQLCLHQDLWYLAVVAFVAPVPVVLFAWRASVASIATRVAAASLLGYAATWITMMQSTVTYAELHAFDPSDPYCRLAIWQEQLGTRDPARRDEDRVWICSAAAGFPLWGIGGADGHLALMPVQSTGFVGPPRLPEPGVETGIYVWRFTEPPPPHLELEYGLGLLWANWLLWSLAAGAVAILLPMRRVATFYRMAVLFFVVGVGCQFAWCGRHLFEF